MVNNGRFRSISCLDWSSGVGETLRVTEGYCVYSKFKKSQTTGDKNFVGRD